MKIPQEECTVKKFMKRMGHVLYSNVDTIQFVDRIVCRSWEIC